MTSHFRASMKILTIVITITTLLCFLAGQVCSDPPRRSRCHQVNCPPGYGISGPCFLDEPPPVCKECTNGTFSSHSSRSAKCRPCRRCDPEREMVLWQCSPTLDTVCVKFRRLDDDGNEFVVRPRILMEKPMDNRFIADIHNKSRQEHAERQRIQQELDRIRAENTTFDDNVTETLDTGIGVEGHEFSTFSPVMRIATSSRDTTVAKIDTIGKASRTNDQQFTTSLHKYLNLVTVEDPGIDLEEDDGPPGQIHRSTGVYTAIISTASFLVVIVVLVLLILIVWLRRARLMTTTCATDECQGYPSDVNTATVTNREYHKNGGYSVVSLDANGEVTTAVIGKSKIPASNYLPPTPLDTGEDGQFASCHGSDVSSTRVQDLQTASKITNKSEAAVRATESPLTSNHLHNPDNVYDIIFEGLFDQKGGVLSHEDSDVQLHIPRGAIPSGEKQLIIVKVSLQVSYFNVGLKDEQIPLTPVVECLSPGLDSFLDYVTVKLPHRALLPGKDAKSWRFLVHYNQSMNPRDKSWLVLDQSELGKENNIVKQMTFSFDEKYVNIQTKHFTKFTCSSCGKTRPILSFDAVAYGKYAPETTEVTVKVYLCDDIKDTQTAVRKAEGDRNPNSTIGIRAKNGMCDWEISCQGSPGKDWKWQINERDGHFPRTQVILLDDIASCCSRNLSPFAEFVFEPRRSSKWEPPNYFDVVFTLQQRPHNEKKRKAMSLVSRSMSVKFPVNEVLALNQVEQCDPLKNLGALEDAECDGAALDKVCEELKVARVRELVRRLLVNYDCKFETSLEDIEERYRDTHERKYQFMLYWQQVASFGATYSRLCTELIHMEMRNVAEALAELWRRKVANTTPKITVV